ncbi:MAG: bifunctional UDP-N-acetylglucosamine diphosphorylase/glucosamine-1-phosphate N-acetyltransferase GlmU [Aminivibrio sp.]
MSGSAGVTGALVLAAGKGTRMKSDLPKVLLPVLDQPVLYFALRALEKLAVDGSIHDTAVVVGHKGELVRDYLAAEWPGTAPIWQHEQLGTGHAVQIAREWWEGFDHLLVLPGDVPMLTDATLAKLVADHGREEADCSFISFRAANPYGYGRVVHSGDGVSIVEEKDATEEQRLLSEVNSGIYIFKVSSLLPHIYRLDNENAQGEFYLPDIIKMMGRDGMAVRAVVSGREDEFRGINTPGQLADAVSLIKKNIVEGMLAGGVRMADPSSVWIGPGVTIEEDVFIDPFVQIWGSTSIGSGSRIGPFSVLRNMTIGRGVEVASHAALSDSSLGDGVRAGPFIVVRDGAEFAPRSQGGKFVEVKNSEIGSRSKVPHLSYIGDATLGEDVNIGAGTITCNYDGVNKNRTVIGDRCFVGSDTMFIAPVSMEQDAATAAGSVISHDVPEGSLAVARARQRNISGWSEKRKKAASRGGDRNDG